MTEKRPLISIITVVLNGGQTLERTLQSVFRQTFRDYEYIVLDGGSTDDTPDLLQKYDREISHWRSEPDNGVYDAMNKGVRLAKGQWLYFLGADDYLHCDLAEVAEYLKDSSTVYYGDVYRPVLNRRYDGRFSAYKLAARNICHQAVFYPRHVLRKYPFELQYKVFADHVLNMRCFADPEIGMQYIPLTIAVFNDAEGLSPNTRDPAFEADRMRLTRENFPYPVYLLMRIRFSSIHLLAKTGMLTHATKINHAVRRFSRRPVLPRKKFF